MQVKETFIGSVYSKTQWVALAIVILGVVQDQSQLLNSLFGEDVTGKAMVIIGAIMAALRVVTTSSLKEKAH